MNGNWLVIDGVRANSKCHNYWNAGDGTGDSTNSLAPAKCKADTPSTIPRGRKISLGCYQDCGNGDPANVYMGEISRDLSRPNGILFPGDGSGPFIIPSGRNEGSIEWCVNFCTELGMVGYKYAGLQNQIECWCGDEFGRFGYREGECNDPCQDQINTWDTCGDACRMNIYTTGL